MIGTLIRRGIFVAHSLLRFTGHGMKRKGNKVMVSLLLVDKAIKNNQKLRELIAPTSDKEV